MNDRFDPILRRRHLVLMLLRSAAVVLLIVAVFSATYTMVRSVQLGQGIRASGNIWGWPAWFGVAAGAAIPGIALMIFGRQIAKWVVPAIKDECPACGYEIRDLSMERCPECGQRLHHDGA